MDSPHTRAGARRRTLGQGGERSLVDRCQLTTRGGFFSVREGVEMQGVLSTGQAARRLEVSSQWVRQLVSRGDLEAIPTPVGLLVKEDSVVALAARRSVKEKAN